MKIKNFIIGLVVGLIAGVSVAILFTPQEGKKTRKLIVEKFKSVRLRLPLTKKNIDDTHIK